MHIRSGVVFLNLHCMEKVHYPTCLLKFQANETDISHLATNKIFIGDHSYIIKTKLFAIATAAATATVHRILLLASEKLTQKLTTKKRLEQIQNDIKENSLHELSQKRIIKK